jgi:1-acyl-sn-glycerol-3-phosphate acyltransferase
VPSIPIDRHNVSLAWLREGRKRLREGHSIFLCPEGHCNEDRVITEFKPGFVTLASAEHVPVVPLYHNAEFNYFFGKRFRLIVGEPIHLSPPPEGLTDEFMRTEAARITGVVRALEKQLIGFNRAPEALPEKAAEA